MGTPIQSHLLYMPVISTRNAIFSKQIPWIEILAPCLKVSILKRKKPTKAIAIVNSFVWISPSLRGRKNRKGPWGDKAPCSVWKRQASGRGPRSQNQPEDTVFGNKMEWRRSNQNFKKMDEFTILYLIVKTLRKLSSILKKKHTSSENLCWQIHT